MLKPLLATVAVLAGGPALAETWRFDWAGANGFRMIGALAFDASASADGLVTQDELDCFYIEGARSGMPLGRFLLGYRVPETTFGLKFDSVMGRFVVFSEDDVMPQSWNMNGEGYDCGSPGFGFNIGNAAQDLCVNGLLQVESQIDPARPFPATRDDGFQFPEGACVGPPVISLLTGPEAAAVAGL